MAQDLFASSPDIDLRKRWALMQMQAGSDSSPVKHPLQAVARALQGAMGGYIGYQAGEADKAAGASMFSGLPGLGGAPVADAAPTPPMTPAGNAPSAMPPMGMPPSVSGSMPSNGAMRTPIVSPGSNVPAPVTGPRPGGPVMPSKTTWGDKEAEDAGHYEKPAAFNTRFAGAPGAMSDQRALPPTATPAQYVAPGTGQVIPQPGGQPAQAQNPPAPNRAQTQIPPDVQDTIKRLGADPRTRPQAWQLYLQYQKPTEQFQTSEVNGRRVQTNLTTGKQEASPTDLPESLRIVNEMMANPTKFGFKGPDDPELQAAARQKLSGMQNSVTVNNAANPVLEGVGKQIVASREKASAASNVVPMIHDARRVLDEGALTGAGADFRVSLQKVGSLFGMDASQASNSEVFKSVIGNEVLGSIKALGANPSNADRSYIEKIMGGEIALEEKSLRKILDIQEKYARQSIGNFNRDSKKLMDANPESYRSIAPLMTFDMPGEYQPKVPGATAAPGAPAVAPKSQYSPAEIEAEIARRKLK